MPAYINSFRDKYSFLSNFHPCRVWMGDGIQYKTVEHAFQAAKTIDMGQRMEIHMLDTPGKAKRAGKKVSLRPGWEGIKIHVMRQALHSKFWDNEDLGPRLTDTGKAILIEGNDHGDTFWGVDGTGENNLGILLMELREQLKERYRDEEERRLEFLSDYF